MKYPNEVCFAVEGRYALFSDPVTRAGGEKCTLQIPTYQALKGILESVYWKPTLIWVIDAVRVCNVIQTQSKGIRPMKYNRSENELAIYTYLKDVRYQVRAHFIWNEQRPDLARDRNEDKHFQIATRMIERGGRRDIFLGTRECQAYVSPCVFGEGESPYDAVPELGFGLMYHGISYPDETDTHEMIVRFWNPVMRKGVIEFCPPQACPHSRTLWEGAVKPFVIGENYRIEEDA
ncbi:type I-C CRISPR-associated protein Cas5c [Ruminococcaceae bacterium OttesenSCG-928-L11]|nr:type I-C CRISPR-associated protein Cas5c [Ruminococcaceae bacterium OttesenSCG-928-L11]